MGKIKILIAISFLGFIALGAYLITGGTNNSLNGNNQYVMEMKSFDKLQASVSYDITIPNYLLSEENLEYLVYADGSIRIKGDRFSYRQGEYIADNVDIAGVYGELSFDKQYKYSHEGNDYLVKYQIGEDFTALSWLGNGKMCGLLMLNYDGINGMDALMNSVGINANNLVEIENTKTDEVKSHKIICDETQVTFELPLEDSSVIIAEESSKNNENKDRIIILLDGKIVAIIEKADVIQRATSANSLKCYEKDGYYLAVLKNNPFESGDSFNKFETLKENFENTVSTFENLIRE